MDIAISIIALLIIGSMAIAGKSFAPWVPSRTKDMKRIFSLLNLKPGEKFYDLGCGDGRMVFYASERSQAKAIGLERAFPMYLACKVLALFHRRSGAIFKWKNFFKENLSDANALYMFGLPDTINKKVKQKLEKELKPGARVVSYAFHIKGWEPVKVDKPGEKEVSVYVYEIPNLNVQ